MRTLKKKSKKTKKINEGFPDKPHKIKRYKRQKCAYIDENGKRCRRKAVGKGTLCKKHGGNPIVKENLIPVALENKQLFRRMEFKAERHPIEFIQYSRMGESEVEIAARFQVTIETLRNWAESYESFSIAYDVGKAMHESWWLSQGKANLNSRHFNTSLYKFLTSNKLGYSDKMETKNMNMNIHGVLKVPDSVSEDEWEKESIEVN